jgi:magnesium-transporting ATPase (P-type)
VVNTARQNFGLIFLLIFLIFLQILLTVAATVSLALGLYQTFRPGSDSKLEWVEGVAILIAVIIVTVAQSVNDFQKEGQFAKLNEKVPPPPRGHYH